MKRVVKADDDIFDPLEGVWEVSLGELKLGISALNDKWMPLGFSVYCLSKKKVDLGVNTHARSTMTYDEISDFIKDLKSIQKDIKNFEYNGYTIVG